MQGRRRRRVLLQQLHHHLDGLFQLRIVAHTHRLRIIFHFNIGWDAVVLHVPGAVRVVEGPVWRAREATIQQVSRIRVVPNRATPRTLANQRTDSCFAEHPRQGIPAGAGHFVGDHHLGAKDGLDGSGDVFAFAHGPVAQQRPPQVIYDVVGDVPAPVVTLVDDGSFLADLRKVVAVEIRITTGVGIGQVPVGHTAYGQFVHLAAVIFDPGVVSQRRFVIHGDDGDDARRAGIRLGADLQHHLFPCGFFKEAVNVPGRAHVAAIYGKEILPDFHVDSWLSERSAEFGIPVLAVVDTRETIAAVLDGIVSAEQPGLDTLGIGNVTATDKHVTDGDLAEHLNEEVIEVITAGDVFEVGLVLLFYGLQA